MANKTFTITGGPEKYSDRGIIPRAISMLFASFQEQSEFSFSCYISYLEIYNENGYDLLASNNKSTLESSQGNNDIPKVTMLEDEDGNYHFRNLSVNPVSSEEDALNLLFLGDTNRAIGETQMNQSSSRSHCIFSIMIEKRKHGGADTVIRSKLNLVDLAGSERVHKTNSTGQTLKEAQYINTSLFFLEIVIVALHEKSLKGKENTHVPYRNSMMTSVLRDSLGGNCKTLMIATISPEASQTDETISTCYFAQRVAMVKNHAYVNEELEPELIISRLKAELKRVREEVKFLKGENGESDDLTDDERQYLEQKVNGFLKDEHSDILDIGKITLVKMQMAFSIFKKFVWKEKQFVEFSNKPALVSSNSIEYEAEFKMMKQKIVSLKKTIQQRNQQIQKLQSIIKGESINHHNNSDDMNADGQKYYHESDDTTSIENAVSQQFEGVKLCFDANILQDPSKAYAWFKDHYEEEKCMQDDKTLLQKKISEAKDAGDIIKDCKDTIALQKSKIEEIRQKMAINTLSGDGVRNWSYFEEQENECLSIIYDCKSKYKENLSRLRELKGSIGHIKELLEKKRQQMHTDFDKWYEYHFALIENNETYEKSFYYLSSQGLRKNDGMSGDVHQHQHHGSGGYHDLTNIHDVVQTSSAQEPKEPYQLPPGVQLTGNKDADEDIIAFYKAKEALLAKSKLNRTL